MDAASRARLLLVAALGATACRDGRTPGERPPAAATVAGSSKPASEPPSLDPTSFVMRHVATIAGPAELIAWQKSRVIVDAGIFVYEARDEGLVRLGDAASYAHDARGDDLVGVDAFPPPRTPRLRRVEPQYDHLLVADGNVVRAWDGVRWSTAADVDPKTVSERRFEENFFSDTGIDLIPRAITLATAHAQSKGVSIDFVEADLLAWSSRRPFDLVFDSGCLHSLIAGSTDRYKRKVVSLLAPSGEYVLCHWGKRNAFDWRPIGPRRRASDDLAALFAPELVEIARHEQLMTDIPLPFGPSILGVTMRFRRA